MRAAIQSFVPIDDSEWETFCSYIHPRRLAKKDHLFTHGQPTLNNLQALSDAELLLLPREGFEDMCARCPSWEKFYRLATQKAYAAIQDRYIQFQAMSAEEKYLWLVKKSPTLFQRVPQHYIASYLGIQPQSLSRIRKKLAVEGPDAPDPK